MHVNDPDSGIPDGGRKQEDVHDHRWDLYSATLAGTINHNIFGHCPEHMPSSGTFYEYEYGPRGGKNEFEMTYRGPAYLRQTDHIIAPSGSLTVMDSYKIHQAYYPDETELTATMVVTDESRGRTKNSVFANNTVHHIIQQSNGTTPTPVIYRDQAIQLVDKTVAALRARRIEQQKHALQKPGFR